MRKLLLTTVTVLGGTAGIAAGAFAQATTTAPPPNVVATTVPNSLKVTLDARINWYAGVEASSADNQFGYKNDPYQFQGYIRLYPGFNATAANGLQYGTAAEVRMPGGAFEGAGTSPGSTSGTETLYWFQAYGYLGTAQVGTFSFGMQNGPTANFETGVFEGFNDGAWNGDVPAFIPGDAVPVYPFSDVNNLQTGDKLVYMSPTWSGFQFGLGFEPNTTNLWNAQCGAASLTCNNLSAAPVPGISLRWRNMIDVGAQYTGTAGPVGIQVGGGYVGSETVHYNGAPTPLDTQYLGLSVGQVGATFTIANVTFGGNLSYGQQDGFYSPQPRGGVDELAWMGGVQYGVGPYIVGASYFRTNFAGGWLPGAGVARTETDQGIAAGATFTIAPGLALYLSYLYGLRHQLGYDFYTGDTGTPIGNNTQSQVFALGTVLKW